MKKPHPAIAAHLTRVRFIDDLPRIDARKLGILDPLTQQTPCCTLLLEGRPCGKVTIEVGDARLQARSIRLVLNPPRSVDVTIKLHFYSMPRGGDRPAFFCPLCNRTAPILYLAGIAFGCRHCVGLPYRSQNVTPLDRTSTMAAKFRKRLFLALHDPLEMAKRPKHMKRSTFERLKWVIEMREKQALLARYTAFARRFL